ncbi:MAG: tetratricopeptide repeat protein [Fulvivirga sp.]
MIPFRIAFLFFFLLSHVALGQNKITLDSLFLRLDNYKSDTSSVKILLAISSEYYGIDYLKALEYATEAKEIAEAIDNVKYQAQVERAIGNLNLIIGNFKNAGIGYFNALEHYKILGDAKGSISMHNNLGAVYDRIQNYDKALEEYFKAVELYNASTFDSTFDALPSLYNNIANIYQTRSDTSAALQYYLKAIELGKKSQNLKVLGISYSNLGKLYFTDLNEPDTAIDYLIKGLETRRTVGDQSEIAKSLLRLGTFYTSQGNYIQGKEYALKAVELSSEISSIETLTDSYLCLSQIEEGLGNNLASLEAYKLYKANSDSLKSKQASNELTRLQLQYDFDKANAVKEEAAKQAKNTYYLIIAALTVGLIIAVLIAIIIRYNSKKSELLRQNLAQDVESKNKELTTNVMYLVRKNELINNVAERLLKIQPKVLPENNKVVNNIILDLQREVDNDSWDEFELRFNQVHTEFYDNLRRLYPDLTPTEEKLCAFLRLNMSTKEIASITQQSYKSVEVARARLRKKLNLTNTSSNLVQHLSNI